MTNSAGKLFVIATPIGNLSDVSQRLVDTLNSVDLILAEDTRHSGKLLKHLMVSTKMQSYHDHNEKDRVASVLEALRAGKNIALISDAGTPLINDPGYHLISALHDEGFEAIPVPGPCALIAALSVSGLKNDRFSFQGFLPAKKAERQEKLTDLKDRPETLIFYESPRRIVEVLIDCQSIFPTERTACIAREMTKIHEEIRRGGFQELLLWLTDHPQKQKGEFVLLIEGVTDTAPSSNDADISRILTILLGELSTKKAAELTARITGEKKNAIYKRALEIEQRKED